MTTRQAEKRLFDVDADIGCRFRASEKKDPDPPLYRNRFMTIPIILDGDYRIIINWLQFLFDASHDAQRDLPWGV